MTTPTIDLYFTHDQDSGGVDYWACHDCGSGVVRGTVSRNHNGSYTVNFAQPGLPVGITTSTLDEALLFTERAIAAAPPMTLCEVCGAPTDPEAEMFYDAEHGEYVCAACDSDNED